MILMKPRQRPDATKPSNQVGNATQFHVTRWSLKFGVGPWVVQMPVLTSLHQGRRHPSRNFGRPKFLLGKSNRILSRRKISLNPLSHRQQVPLPKLSNMGRAAKSTGKSNHCSRISSREGSSGRGGVGIGGCRSHAGGSANCV